MTCVVGIEYKRKLYFGADSAASNNDTIDIIDRSKIVSKPGILIGYCGSFRVGQILEYQIDYSTLINKERWLFTDFVEQLREEFEERGVKIHDEHGEGIASASDLLIGFNKKLYYLQSDYSIIRSKRKYMAIGSGDHLALGALFALEGLVADPQKRLRIALRAASEWSPGVAPPFKFFEI